MSRRLEDRSSVACGGVDDDLRERLLGGAQVTQRRVQLAGVSTPVLEAGDGPPVVLLHGQGAFAAVWLSALAGLAPTHRVLAPDLPGLGASEAPGGPLGADEVLAWLAELLDSTCPAPPALVGLSLGGQLAARFVADHPGVASRLVLVDTPGLVGRVRPAPGTLLALLRHGARPSERSTMRLLEHLVVDLDRVRRQMGDRWEPFLAYMVDRARDPDVRRANRRLMRDVGLQQVPPDVLVRLDLPVTLVWGRHDRVAPLHTAQQAGERYGWPLHVVDDAGHLVLAEQPDAVLRALRSALEGR